MKTHAKVVVVGGGVVGASVLYHLAKAGWTDVLLLERAELTAGSTWHAAGGMHTVNGDPNVAKLQQYTIELYKEIEALSGQSCGVHLTGGVMLAGTAGAARLVEDGQGAGPLPRHGPRTRLHPRGQGALPADGRKALRRRPLRPDRRPCRPLRGHPCLCQIGPDQGRHDRAAVPGHRPAAAARRHLGRHHGKGQRPGRARRECRRPLGARGGPHGGPGAPGPRHGAPLPDHRGHARTRRAEGTDPLHRFRGRDLHAPGAGRHADGDLRAERQTLVAARDPVGFRPEPAARRPRPHLREPRSRVRAFPGDRQGRVEEGGQRPVHLLARRQPADRAGPGAQELLGGLRRDGGVQPGRRRRTDARQLDGRRRPGLRRLGHGRVALRRLDHHGLYQRQGARELWPALPHPFPQRGTRGRAPACARRRSTTR